MLDKLIVEFDKIVQTIWGSSTSKREHPDAALADGLFSNQEKSRIVGLMRVNHCGEVCAQALYQGQSLTLRSKLNKEIFAKAAFEETEHLAWLSERVSSLGGKTSILTPLFYVGSLGVGVIAGICGDKWSLGFLEETERQVEMHLMKHLQLLPENDGKSKAILDQMIIDERGHADTAHNHGANDLPKGVKLFMSLCSKIMTKNTYYL